MSNQDTVAIFNELDINSLLEKEVTFEVIKDIYWDDWGHFRKVFRKGDVCKGILYPDGEVTAESPYYNVSDIVDLGCIKIL